MSGKLLNTIGITLGMTGRFYDAHSLNLLHIYLFYVCSYMGSGASNISVWTNPPNLNKWLQRIFWSDFWARRENFTNNSANVKSIKLITLEIILLKDLIGNYFITIFYGVFCCSIWLSTHWILLWHSIWLSILL